MKTFIDCLRLLHKMLTLSGFFRSRVVPFHFHFLHAPRHLHRFFKKNFTPICITNIRAANRTLIVINCRIIFSFCKSTGGLCARVCRIHLSFVKMMFLERLGKLSERQSSKKLSSKAQQGNP